MQQWNKWRSKLWLKPWLSFKCSTLHGSTVWINMEGNKVTIDHFIRININCLVRWTCFEPCSIIRNRVMSKHIRRKAFTIIFVVFKLLMRCVSGIMQTSGVFADQCANTSPLEMDSLLEPRVKKVHVSFSVLEIAAFFFFCGQQIISLWSPSKTVSSHQHVVPCVAVAQFTSAVVVLMSRCALHFSCEQVESTSLSGVGRHKPLKLGRSGCFLSGTRTHMRVKKHAVITKTVRSNQSDTTKQHRCASSPVLAREGRLSDTLNFWPLPQPTHCTTCSTSQSYLDSCTPAPKGQRSLFEDASVDILDQKDRWFERGGC